MGASLPIGGVFTEYLILTPFIRFRPDCEKKGRMLFMPKTLTAQVINHIRRMKPVQGLHDSGTSMSRSTNRAISEDPFAFRSHTAESRAFHKRPLDPHDNLESTCNIQPS